MIKRTRVLVVAMLAVMVVVASALNALTAPTQTALAQATCTADFDLVVQPTSVLNTSATTITVFGTFTPANSVVILRGFGTLATTVAGAGLSAEVPAGVPAGRYDVEVLDQVSQECDILNNGLRVRAPDITDTPSPTETPLPTDFIRPVITVLSYVPSTTPPLFPGQEFDFAITLQNTGQVIAKNVIVVFPAGDVVPRNTGGTRTIGDLVPGATASFSQPLRVVSSLGGYEAVITVQVSYTDQYGNPYTETSVLSFEAGQYVDTPTPTATLSVRPQLVIESSTTTPATLAPGTMFRLDVALVNVSGEAARQVVVTILASTSGTGETTTTTSSTTGDLSPVNGSNVRYVDQMAAGERITLSYDLAVAGDAAGGLVPVDVALSYIDNFNVQHDETAAISLAVESPAFFQVNLFEALPDLIQVGDLFEIPVEVINIGEDSVNVNTVEVTSDNRLRISEGSLYVGPLDGGTSATLIAQAEALQAGTAEVEIHINYLDAFQQPREYIETLSIEIEAVPLDVGPDEGEDGTSEEDGELTLVERLWRALLGFLGLGTRPAEESLPVPPGSTPVPSGEGDSE